MDAVTITLAVIAGLEALGLLGLAIKAAKEQGNV